MIGNVSDGILPWRCQKAVFSYHCRPRFIWDEVAYVEAHVDNIMSVQVRRPRIRYTDDL